jgi:hypothetical protein
MESIAEAQAANELRILVLNQQIAVLLQERRRQEELGHRLIDAMISYQTRNHLYE